MYVNRIIKLPFKKNFFLFGARNTGKSTLLRTYYSNCKALWIDLLDPLEEDRYTRNPEMLKSEVLANQELEYVIIDGIQKIPKLLNVIHQLIESTNLSYILTGPSARKLKYGGANLLAGRAFVYNLFPFSFLEIENNFKETSARGTIFEEILGASARSTTEHIEMREEPRTDETTNLPKSKHVQRSLKLNDILRWGSLPSILFSMESEDEKIRFLNAYSQTYIKEEIWMEQFVRKLDPFRRFLEVSAQSNGQIINYASISRDVGTDEKTIKQYFSILEDTLLGFYLEPFHHSFRKRLSQKPKFYYFDIGVKNSLSRTLSIPVQESTSSYGFAFEHFIILEIIKLAKYFFPEYKFSYLKTKDGVEIDLVVERPGEKILFIEIKSATNVCKEQLISYLEITKDFGECEAICLSKDIRSKKIENITVYPWRDGIEKYFSPFHTNSKF